MTDFIQYCNYKNGYNKALSDVFNWFEKHSESLKFHKMYNNKSILALLKCMSNNSESMLELGEDCDFIIKKDGKSIIVTLGELNEI